MKGFISLIKPIRVAPRLKLNSSGTTQCGALPSCINFSTIWLQTGNWPLTGSVSHRRAGWKGPPEVSRPNQAVGAEPPAQAQPTAVLHSHVLNPSGTEVSLNLVAMQVPCTGPQFYRDSLEADTSPFITKVILKTASSPVVHISDVPKQTLQWHTGFFSPFFFFPLLVNKKHSLQTAHI